MSIGLYDHDRRYRQRFWGNVTRIGFYLGTLGVVSAFAYQTGIQQVVSREDRLVAQIDQLQTARAVMQQQVMELRATAQAATERYDDLLAQYNREVPQGEWRDLSNLVAERLEDGIPVDRLEFVIRSAAEPRDCTEPESKRFILTTPAYSGANTSVGFASGRVTVTGRGENARNEEGGLLGWFDPAATVTATFTVIGGQQESVAGLLPLHHSMVIDGEEYRFTVLEGERSFVTVTADRCPFL